MSDIQSQLPVKLTNNTNTVGITSGSALQIAGTGTAGTADANVVTVQGIASMTALQVAGTVTASPTGTYTVTATSMTVVSPTAANLKAQVIGAGTAGSADAGVVTVQGIASMTALQVAGTVTASPTGTYTVAGTVTATPTGTYTVTATSLTVVSPTAANLKAQVVGAGTAGSADAGVVTVQGIASMTALQVAGTVTASPTGTYTVAGTVTASPTGTYTVAGTVTASPTGTYTVVQGTAANLKAQVTGTGTAGTPDTGVVSVQGISSGYALAVTNLSQAGAVVNYQTSASLANASTATLSYTVTAGKTLYIKGVIASSSGAPCKVILDYGASPTVLAVGFYSASSPYLEMNFVQAPAITATTVVNIKIQNNAGAAQDVYCTLMGEER